jgi:hypothetical protein
MTDIIERLRAMLACDPECEGRCQDCPNSVAGDAADEIERLRASQEVLIQQCDRAIQIGNTLADQRDAVLDAARPLLNAVDEVLAGLARGECEQHLYHQFAPVVGAFRALLLEDER